VRSFRRLILMCCCLMAAFALAGCAAILPAAPAPTAAPARTPSPSATPVPAAPNPLGVYFGAFSDACAPFQAQLSALGAKDAAYVDETLSVQGHIQRLQQFFLAPSGLWQSDDEGAVWSGILFGAIDGTGTVQKIPGGCAFTCTFSDKTYENPPGGIEGALIGNRLTGAWNEEGVEPREGEIEKTPGGFFSLVTWGDERTALSLEGDTLYFGADAAAGASSLPPGAWAGWSLCNGVIRDVSAATNSSVTK